MRLSRTALAGGFCALSALAFPAADIALPAPDPWADLAAIAHGFAPPAWADIAWTQVVLTVAFAVVGVAIGAVAGFALSLAFERSRAVRVFSASLRSIHELFWALLLLQITGLSPWTGLLAVAIPYAGIFAKVFAEIVEEASFPAEAALPPAVGGLTRFLWTRAPVVWPAMRGYTLYRLECGLRSSLVLGFIGVPTIGDELVRSFRPGGYHEAAALLLVFYALIATRGLWARVSVLPVLLPGSVAALAVLAPSLPGAPIGARLARFGHAVVPAPLRDGGDFGAWLADVLWRTALPGALQTLVVSQLAALLAALLALALFPWVSRRLTGAGARVAGRAMLILVRGTPDYLLAWLLLQVLGPSMLPAIVALGLQWK